MIKLNIRRFIPQKTLHRVWVATLALLLLTSSILPIVLRVGHADALTNFVQNDWSGGVGADVGAHQY